MLDLGSESQPNEIQNHDILIIGAGPAGMTAGIYAARAGMKVAFIEKSAPGGKMIKTHIIENYPGIKTIGGPELSMQMFEQTESVGVEFLYGDVVNISVDGDERVVHCDDGSEFRAKTLIIATGTNERKVGVPGEEEYYGKGVSYCAVCDGSLYKGKTVVVIGGGNSAIEEGLYLSSIVGKVILVHRRQGFRAPDILVEKLKNKPNVEFILDSVATEMIGNGDEIQAIKILNVLTGKEQTINVSCIFPYIGLDPVTDFVKSLGIVNEDGYIEVNEHMETAVSGIFAAGDVNKKPLRQIATAVGDAATAAVSAKTYFDAKF